MSGEVSNGLTTLECEGLAWVDHLISGEATESDLVTLRQWRSQSLAHDEAFVRAVRLRRSVEAWRRTRTSATGAVISRSMADARPSRRLLLGVGAAIAASLGTVALVRPPLDLWPSLEALQADYRTGKGERRQISVGTTRLELNTQTAVALIDGGIRLVDGETAVNVSRTPFRVVAGEGMVETKNSRLNVRCIGAAASVACLSGQARLSHRQGGSILLNAGDLVRYDLSGLGSVQPADEQSVEAWRRGFLFFRNTRLSEVVAEVNRYRPGLIILGNSKVAHRRFNGVFRMDRMDDVLAQIRAASGGSHTVLPGGLIVLG